MSAWEVAIKADAGKLHLKGTAEERFEGHGLTVLTSGENIASYPGVKTVW